MHFQLPVLQEILSVKRKIIFRFDLKTKGRFRFKKFRDLEIASTYNRTISKEEELYSTKWYLEWQISYSELSNSLRLAISNNMLKKETLDDLVDWISKVSEENILETKLKPSVRPSEGSLVIQPEGEFSLIQKELRLITAQVDLPFFIYKHSSGVWTEIVWEKQQKAYSFQPMVYLCIPHDKFTNQKEWHLPEEEVDLLLDLFKIFGIASKKHRNDVLKILNDIKKSLEKLKTETKQ